MRSGINKITKDSRGNIIDRLKGFRAKALRVILWLINNINKNEWRNRKIVISIGWVWEWVGSSLKRIKAKWMLSYEQGNLKGYKWGYRQLYQAIILRLEIKVWKIGRKIHQRL